MYRVSYQEIMDDDCGSARLRERQAMEHAIALMKGAEEKGADSPEAEEAIQYVQKLWVFFIEDLCHPDNQLAADVKQNLISIGVWSIAESHRILARQSASFTPLININTAVSNGLS